MAMVVKNNMDATKALNTLNVNSKNLEKSLKKVSSGMKINSAADDASGLAISEQMRVQLRSLSQATSNAQSAASMLRTAEGVASSTVDILKTLKEKAINAANDSNTDADRAIIQKELDQSIDQISDNANVTFNGIRLFTGDVDTSSDTKSTIIKALNSDWIKSSLDMIQDAYGISFESGFQSTDEIEVQFSNEGASAALAHVDYTSVGGLAQDMKLVVNMDYYGDMDPDDPNGVSGVSGAGYLDRTIAHEMTHAVMAANIKDMASAPIYVIEGLAELTHGIDDERLSSLSDLKTKKNWEKSGGSDMYATGYAYMRFLAKQNSGDADTAIKSMMETLVQKGGGAYDEAISAASGGAFKTDDEAKAAFEAALAASASSKEFLLQYCDIDLDNPDTGSILGSDARTGEERDPEATVLEGLNTDFWYYPTNNTTRINGLDVKWPAFNRGEQLKFQIGTKANQVISAGFGDISAEGLGLKADSGETLSVGTRVKATRAITILDKAIEKALDQQTNIGSLQSRLEYTEDNLVTANENTTAAESVIRDSDMAKEMTEYTKNNVLMQASQSMLSQANQSSSNALNLLQGS